MFFTSFAAVFSQTNIEKIGQLDPYTNANYNDIWGYTDGEGGEYAILGVETGTSIIDVTNPSEPEEVAFISGANSTWRDMKVHDNYAYIVTEGSGPGTGLQIIDLSELPEDANLVNTTTEYFTTAHNIFIDDGYAFVVGGSGEGGIHILDLSNPEQPERTALYTASGYVHDLYVWNDTLVACAADTYDLVDISDKSNPVIISQSPVLPGIYAHSGWMTEDKQYFLATEEFNQRDLTVWDLSDRETWNLVIDKWDLPGDSPIHNLFIKGDYAHISYYKAGYVVLDISDPENPLLLGQYNTHQSSTGNYAGAWGCYPYLPSGNVLISDMQKGLYIFQFNENDLSPWIVPTSSAEYVTNTNPVRLSAQITDNGLVSENKLFYRTIIDSSESEWNIVEGEYDSQEEVYNYTLPGFENTTKVEYYFLAVDDSNIIATYPMGGSAENPPEELLSYQVALIGEPVLIDYSPRIEDSTIIYGERIEFSVEAEDTSGFELSYEWLVNDLHFSDQHTLTEVFL